MYIRNLFAAIVGTIVVFAWSSASWMILPWHYWDMKSFKKEGHVITESVQVEAPESGIYTVPNFSADAHKTPDTQKAWSDKAQHGPFVFMAVKAKGLHWDMNVALAIQFATQFLVALCAAWLVAQSCLVSAFSRAFLVCVAVSLGSVLTNIANWNWWGFPFLTTLVNIADIAIGWYLGGFFIGIIVKKKA